MVYEVVSGFIRHAVGYVCSKSATVNIFAYSAARGIRVAFDHHYFTIHRFRLLNIVPDFISWAIILWNMNIASELVLGRSDEDGMSYIEIINGKISKFTFEYTNKIGIPCRHWKIKSITEIFDLLPYTQEDDRITHLGPRPLLFSSSFLVPKHKTVRECKKWILYIPGGAFITHSVHFIPRLHSSFPGYGICHLRYSLVPEKSFPNSLIDALDTYNFLLEYYKIEPNNIVLFADSAGGNVLLNLLLGIKENKLPSPRCCVLVSPWSDLSCSGDSWQAHKNIDFLDSDLQIDLLLSLYSTCNVRKEKHVLKHPFFSPVFGDLEGLPPLLIQSAVYEAIYDDNIVLYDKLIKAGNLVEHHIYEGMTHAFQCFPYKESGDAFQKIKEFVNKHH